MIQRAFVSLVSALMVGLLVGLPACDDGGGGQGGGGGRVAGQAPDSSMVGGGGAGGEAGIDVGPEAGPADLGAGDAATICQIDCDGGDAAGGDGGELQVVVVEPAEGAGVAGLTRFAARVEGGVPDDVAFDLQETGGAGCRAADPDEAGLFRCAFDVSVLASGPYTLIATAHTGADRAQSDPVHLEVLGEAPPGARLLPGAIDPPAGQLPGDYEVGTTLGLDDQVGALGGFVVPVEQAGVSVVVGIPAGGPEDATNLLLAIWPSVPGEPAPSEPPAVLLTPESTAAALVFLHPFFFTDEPMAARRLLELAPQIDELGALAQAIDASYGATPHPFADPAFDERVAAAVDRMVELMPGDTVPGLGGSLAGNQRTFRVMHLDGVGQTHVAQGEGNIKVSTELTMALDSALILGEVDLDAAHQLRPGDPRRLRSLADLRDLRNRLEEHPPFFPTFTLIEGSRHSGLAPANSFFKHVAVLRRAAGLLVGPLGLQQPTNELPLDTSRPGLYLLRAYSGRLSSGIDEGEFDFAWGHDPEWVTAAVVLNVAAGAIDLVSVVIDVTAFANPCLQGMVQTTMDHYLGLDLADPALGSARSVMDVIGRSAQALISCGVGELKRQNAKGIAEVLKSMGRVMRAVLGTLDLANKVGRIGKTGDRALTLVGLPGLTGTGVLVTPLDTQLIVVGDPFSPEVIEIEIDGERHALEDLVGGPPLVVDPAAELVLHGARFAGDDDGRVGVSFEDQTGLGRVARAEVVSSEVLRITLPDGLAGRVAARIEGPGDGFELGEVLVIRPRVDRVAPAVVFSGDDVFVEGAGLLPFYSLRVGEDRRFEGVVQGAADGRVRYRVSIPPGRYPLVLETGLDGVGAVDLDDELVLLGPPLVDADQDWVQGGALFSLRGHNFGLDPDRLDLELMGAEDQGGRALGTSGPLNVWDAGDREGPSDAERLQPAFLTAAVGLRAPEDAVLLRFRLTTPAGEVRFALPANGPQGPTFDRSFNIATFDDLQAASAFISGRAPLGQQRHYEYRDVGRPPVPDWRCVEVFDPPPWLMTWPPGIGGVLGCPAECIGAFDPDDCPSSWDEVAPDRVMDHLEVALQGRLDPVEITAEHLSLVINAGAGGGLVLRGAPGARSNIQADVMVDAPDGFGPVVTLRDVHGARLRLRINDGGACDTAVLVEDSDDVELELRVVGCAKGAVVRRSTDVRITPGVILHRDVGVWFAGGSALSVTTEIHGGGGTLDADGVWQPPLAAGGATTGVRIDGGAERVVVDVIATGHGTAVDIGEASHVRVQGKFGMIGRGLTQPTWGNAVAVDVHGGPGGPATAITVGGEIPGFGSYLPTVFAHNGVGVRASGVHGLKVRDSFFGLRPRDDTDLSNGTAIEVRAGAESVSVVHNHILGSAGSAGPALTVEGATHVLVWHNLFAGISTGRWDRDHVVVPLGADDHCDPTQTLQPARYDRLGYEPASTRSAVQVRVSENVSFIENTYIGSEGACLAVENSSDIEISADRAFGCGAGVRLSNVGGARIRSLHVLANQGDGLVLDGVANARLSAICARANEGLGLRFTGSPRDWSGRVRVWGSTHHDPRESVAVPPPGQSAPGWRRLRSKAPPPGLLSSRGTVVLENGLGGVQICDGDVPVSLSGLIVSGNGGPGVEICRYAGDVELTGSDIGVGWRIAPGAQPNDGHGVSISEVTGSVSIGVRPRGNVISGNAGSGVFIDGAERVVVADNFIGTDPDGTSAMPNGQDGVEAYRIAELRVGAGEANLISGNAGFGVSVAELALTAEVLVSDNYIGVDRVAAVALPNGEAGVAIQGGVLPRLGDVRIADNLISGNAGLGLWADRLRGRLTVTGNGIGQNHTGINDPRLADTSLPNEAGGVLLEGVMFASLVTNAIVSDHAETDGLVVHGGAYNRIVDNVIAGAPGACVLLEQRATSTYMVDNQVFGCGDGVRVSDAATSNRIQRNTITRNARGIWLERGGNNLIPAPVVSAITLIEPGARWVVRGRVDRGVPDGSTVEVFADERGQGRVLLGSEVVVGGRFLARFDSPPPAALAPAESLEALTISATVTDRDGNTSPFGGLEGGPGPACPAAAPAPGLALQGLEGRAVLIDDAGASLVGLVSGERLRLQAPIEGRVSVCGPRLVWSGGEPGARDLFALDLSQGPGGAVSRLTDGGDNVEPSLSPDCSRVAYASDQGAGWGLLVIDAEGGAAEVLTEAGVDRWPTWAPDGERLAFVRGDADEGVIMVRLAGGQVAPLIDAAGAGAPAWHPSEERLAYHRCDPQGGGCTVWVADLGSDRERALGLEGCDDRGPSWAIVQRPDDRPQSHLLFTRGGEGILATDLGYTQWTLGEGTLAGCCAD